MHESYNKDDPFSYTRSWFCWADSLFAEFVLSLTQDDIVPKPIFGPAGKLEREDFISEMLQKLVEQYKDGFNEDAI